MKIVLDSNLIVEDKILQNTEIQKEREREIRNSSLETLTEMEFFLIIQSRTQLHRLDVKHYFQILVCQKCKLVSYHTCLIPSQNLNSL